MKKIVKVIVIIAVLLVVFGMIGASVNKSLHKPPPPPRTAVTHLGDLTIKVSETGTIEPDQKVDVKSKVAGRLLTIPIQEGQNVQKGQLIATVDTTLILPQIQQQKAQLAQAQAAYAQAQAQYALQLQQSQMNIRQAQASVSQAQAHLQAVKAVARPQELAQKRQALERAQIALDDALRTQKRRQALVAKGFISQADADAAQVAVDTAQSTLGTAQQDLALMQAGPRAEDIADAQAAVRMQQVQLASAKVNALQNAVTKAQVAQAAASVQQSENTLAQLMVNLSDTRIIAPASGIVLKKYKQPTEIVQSATTGFSDTEAIVATLGNRPLVRVGINEVDIPKVRLGASVVVHVDALPGVEYGGVVSEIAPASTNAFSDSGGSSGGSSSISKFSVKVSLLGVYDGRLRPGMSAQVDILSVRHHNVILAPLEAVPIAGSQGSVTVLTPDKKQEKRPVTLGLRDDTQVEVVSGLRAGETLVIPPLQASDRRKLDIQAGG